MMLIWCLPAVFLRVSSQRANPAFVHIEDRGHARGPKLTAFKNCSRRTDLQRCDQNADSYRPLMRTL